MEQLYAESHSYSDHCSESDCSQSNCCSCNPRVVFRYFNDYRPEVETII